MRPKPKPEEVDRLLRELAEEEKKHLRKDNPFRVDRNNAIKRLYRRGVKVCVIAAITGLSEMTVLRAVRNNPKFQTKALKVKI